MRNIKQILRGEFYGEDKEVIYYKCKDCGYANHTGTICPFCGNKECERMKC